MVLYMYAYGALFSIRFGSSGTEPVILTPLSFFGSFCGRDSDTTKGKEQPYSPFVLALLEPLRPPRLAKPAQQRQKVRQRAATNRAGRKVIPTLKRDSVLLLVLPLVFSNSCHSDR